MPICRVDKRVKFLPPLWESAIPLQISLDPLTRVIGVNVNPFPWFLSFPGRATLGCSGGDRSSSLLSRFYKPGDFCNSRGRTLHSWLPISFTQQGSLLFWSGEGPDSSSVGLSNIIPNGDHQRGHALLRLPGGLTENACCPLMTLHKPTMPRPKPASFPAWWPRNPGGWRQEGESPRGKAHGVLVGHPTTLRLPAVPLAAWQLPPAIGQNVGQQGQCVPLAQCVLLSWSSHWP